VVSRRVVIGAGIGLAIVLGGFALSSRDDPAQPEAEAGPQADAGAQDVIGAYETLEVAWPPDAGPMPPLVVPDELPEGWRYASAESNHGPPTGGSMQFEFVQESAGTELLPHGALCVSRSDKCPSFGERGSQPVTLSVPGLQGEALLYGEADVLEQWEDVQWTADPGPAGR
jgi:hypothetical protein